MCNCNCTKSDLSLLEGVLARYGGDSGNLITVLQKAQEIYGYLPVDVIYHIADKMDSTPAKVMGVATFYTQFRLKPVGKYLIMLCKGTACHVNGADGIEKAICEHLGIEDGGTTEDGLFSLKNVACLGCCSLSPVMMINDDTYGSLTPQKAVAILEDLRKEAAE
ncbi:MAG: NADH-quinone oxidoreductase subunit NuoE [Clostridia bacterium]|nr:NADH-quinone oxidoreductase subunit NuoE [Clostridia bacterium]